MTSSDDALIRQYLEGDLAAFERLYRRYAPRLLGFLVGLGAPADVTEDLAQQAWMRAIDGLEGYRPDDRFRPWLFTIARRIWIDEVRSAWRRHRRPLDDHDADLEWPDPSDGPVERSVADEQRRRVHEAIAELPPSMRQTVLLRIDGAMTHREIAGCMDCPLGTVLWRVKEAERRLAKRLGRVTQEQSP